MRKILFTICLLCPVLFACGGTSTPPANPVVENWSSPPVNADAPKLSVVDRPQKIKDLMAGREEQDSAAPTIRIVEPEAGATFTESTVKVKLELSGDLKGYEPGMDEKTHTGNHIHVILDNQPYEAYYHIDKPFELRNVANGEHTIRVFPSRPWHESYKNDGAFQMVRFTVANPNPPMGNPNTNTAANSNAKKTAANSASASTTEGKDMQPTSAGPVDPSKPLLTYSRPKGEYKGEDANAIMLDFWLLNAKLKDDGGEYRVRYSIDGGEFQYIDKWAPIWLTGWPAGKHTVELALIDKDGRPDVNGGYNSTTREITISK